MGGITARHIVIAEVVPQAGGTWREPQRAPVEYFSFVVFLFRVEDKAEQAKQVGPVWLDGYGFAEFLLGLIQMSLLKRGGSFGVNIAGGALGRSSDVRCG